MVIELVVVVFVAALGTLHSHSNARCGHHQQEYYTESAVVLCE